MNEPDLREPGRSPYSLNIRFVNNARITFLLFF